MTKKLISVVIHIYNNQEVLNLQTNAWQEWSDIKELELIFIDDGSNPRLDTTKVPNWVKKFRVIEDIPWNQPGAKNLASHVSTGEWLFFLDADQLLQRDQIIALIKTTNQLKVAQFTDCGDFVQNPKKNYPAIKIANLSPEKIICLLVDTMKTLPEIMVMKMLTLKDYGNLKEGESCF